MKLNRQLPIILLATLSGFAMPAHAYLDPSTGSMILSAIVGIFATVGLALKTYWYKFKSFFKGQKDTPDVSTVAETAQATEKEQQ